MMHEEFEMLYMQNKLLYFFDLKENFKKNQKKISLPVTKINENSKNQKIDMLWSKSDLFKSGRHFVDTRYAMTTLATKKATN